MRLHKFHCYNAVKPALAKPVGSAGISVIAIGKKNGTKFLLQNTILPFSSKHKIFLPRAIHLQHQNSRRQGLRWDATAIAQPPLPCCCTSISSPRDIRTIVLASPHILFTIRIIKQQVSIRLDFLN
ncbi:hypothetical protein WN944_028631 [Citrus x changshan-huyou]|uniref:Uncharacterized protein n=1 Tax=Citrus x changshan-huyou TaxID=2935761 RepID=A0AAP0QAD0_9ROSI